MFHQHRCEEQDKHYRKKAQKHKKDFLDYFFCEFCAFLRYFNFG